jgi:uncharacterized protein YgiM (DUF1202 family)
MPSHSVRKLIAAAILCTWAIGAAVLADDIWVKSPAVTIRSGMGSMFPVTATAKKGDKLTVLDQQGKWYHVQVGDATGYVFSGAISPKQVSADAGLASAGGIETGTDSAAAGKGLEGSATQWASSKNLDPKPLDDLIKWNNALSPADWDAFAKAGKVGPYKPTTAP